MLNAPVHVVPSLPPPIAFPFQYLGNRASQRVKQKIIEMLYRWSIEMKHHSKIQEAYQMLKKQGVIAVDPVYVIEVRAAASLFVVLPDPHCGSTGLLCVI